MNRKNRKKEISMAVRERYVNFYTDFAFKKLFGTEANKDLLMAFLNALLDGREEIRDLTYLNVEHLGHVATDRKAVFDVYCENSRGEKFLIEMQKAEQEFFKDRSIYYSTFPIQEQAPQALQDAVFRRFFEQAEIAGFTEAEQRTYRESLKDYWDLFSVTETAEKKGRRAGLAEGMEKGMKKGMVKGRKAGLKEGEAIGLEKGGREKALAIARQLKQMGLSDAQILQATGLTAGELEAVGAGSGC